jgi:16S rRNA (adenine1518-N6/adenine1519-N6)-dimethyltransferase
VRNTYERRRHGSPKRRRPGNGPPIWLLRLLRLYRIYTRRSLGQNFLIDQTILDRIVSAAKLNSDDLVVEIGAGTGELTEQLAERARRVLAIEIDPKLVQLLGDRFTDRDNVEIIQQDATTMDMADLTDGETYRVIGNLPYSVASPILRTLLESSHPPTQILAMLQREVALRLVAPPGRYNLLGISVLIYAEPELCFEVPATAFFPSPEVSSAVVRLNVRASPLVPDHRDEFFRIVSAGFAHSRKQIHNSIPRVLWSAQNVIDDVLLEAKIDPQLRAQNLTIDDWIRLRNRFLACDLL